MKIHFLLFVLFGVLSAHSTQAQQAVDSSRLIRILSFNIYHGATMQGDFDLDTIAAVIKKVHPDLVALQEVDFKTRRAKGYDLATELGWRTQLAPLFGQAMQYDGGAYGEAILSAFPYIKSINRGLPYSPGNEPRAALQATIVLPSGDTIAFAGTHLDHLEDETDRIAQANEINRAFSKTQFPQIIAGDFNAIPGSLPIQLIETEWAGAYNPEHPTPTYPSDAPELKIDYVFFAPAHRWRVLESRVICDTVASDHCAYLVVLELLPE
ncbi:MAG: endonuclease/exonuclease/phosphatase family protein [Saprospiraceae bacterium]